ncbi:MAG: choice-of-anchor M domain-containing protein [Angustibacter sp.]
MRTTTRWLGVLAATVSAVLGVALAAPAHAATYSRGHFDLLDIDYGGTGSPTLDVKRYSPVDDDVNPSGDTFLVPSGARGTLGSGLSCVGSASSQVYRLPQTANSRLLYAGWNAENSTRGATVELVRSSVPSGARFALYQATTGSVSVKLNTASGTCRRASFAVAAGSHAHGNWVFTQAGTYRLTFRATVGTARSSEVTLTFRVG